MPISRIQINVSQLNMGMFVANLDCGWDATPFPIQGFYIRKPQQIEQLKRFCRTVIIDKIKGEPPLNTKSSATSFKRARGTYCDPINQKRIRLKPITAQVNTIKIQHNTYSLAKPISTELKQAKRFHDDVKASLSAVSKQVMNGKTLTMDKLKSSVGNMVDSIIRSPDTFTWLCKVNDKDNHTYNHALRCAVWAVIFGRHMGLSKHQLDLLAASVLLKDIGKIKLPKALIEKKNKTEKEQKLYESFVMHSVNMLKESSHVDKKIIQIVEAHCERVNGSGFPKQLEGDKIPLLSKIVGLVSFYDNIVNPRQTATTLSPSKATAQLYELRGYDFQEQLIVEFIQAIGLYPTGTAVVLSTGEVGLIIEQNSQHRLKPKIMVLIDKHKSHLGKPIIIDMAKLSSKKTAEKVEISRDIEVTRLGIDNEQIKNLLLQQSEHKGLMAKLNIFR